MFGFSTDVSFHTSDGVVYGRCGDLNAILSRTLRFADLPMSIRPEWFPLYTFVGALIHSLLIIWFSFEVLEFYVINFCHYLFIANLAFVMVASGWRAIIPSNSKWSSHLHIKMRSLER